MSGFRTLTARRADTCRRCGGPIAAGSTIRWAPRAGAYHLSAECGTGDDAPRGWTPGDTGTYYGASTGRSVVTRFSSGAEIYRNSRGRCEDAPCCGCCS